MLKNENRFESKTTAAGGERDPPLTRIRCCCCLFRQTRKRKTAKGTSKPFILPADPPFCPPPVGRECSGSRSRSRQATLQRQAEKVNKDAHFNEAKCCKNTHICLATGSRSKTNTGVLSCLYLSDKTELLRSCILPTVALDALENNRPPPPSPDGLQHTWRSGSSKSTGVKEPKCPRALRNTD